MMNAAAPGNEDGLPPGPADAIDLDADAATFALLQELCARYGDICYARSRRRAGPIVVLNHPNFVRHVLVTNSRNYEKGGSFERVKLLLGNGIFVSNGAFWRRQRRMIQPGFSKMNSRSLFELVRACHLDLVERWERAASLGQVVNVMQETSELALAVMLNATFGSRLPALPDGGQAFTLLVNETRRDFRFVARFRALIPLVHQAIRTPCPDGEPDLLSHLLRARDANSGAPMSLDALVDEVMTLIVSGHETTAATLGFVWGLLSENPDAEASVQREADALPGRTPCFDDLAALEQTKGVICETLRLYPPGWLFSRRALADDSIAGYRIPARTEVIVSPYLLHRHPGFWEQPDEFRPHRFANEELAKRHVEAYIPFSLGPRRCIGEFFATTTALSHVAAVARIASLDRVRHADRPLIGVNLRPPALWMRLRRRRA